MQFLSSSTCSSRSVLLISRYLFIIIPIQILKCTRGIKANYNFVAVLQVEQDGGHKTTMSSNRTIPLNTAITQDIRIIDIITISIDPHFMQVIDRSANLRLHGLRTSRGIQCVTLSLPLRRTLLIQRAWIGQEAPSLTNQGGSLDITLLCRLHLHRNRSTLG